MRAVRLIKESVSLDTLPLHAIIQMQLVEGCCRNQHLNLQNKLGERLLKR